MDDEEPSRGCGRCSSRSPTACSARSARPRTSCRRRSSATTAPPTAGTEIESPKAYLSDGRDAARDRPAPLGAGAARELRRHVAARAAASPTTAPDAAEHAETADSLSLAFLVVLESLSPVERAVFLLREVFDYDYERDRGDRRQERGQHAASSRYVPAGTSRSAAALRSLARAARRARASASSPRCGDGRCGRARGDARRRRRALRRRRRQGARDPTADLRSRAASAECSPPGASWVPGPACTSRLPR